MSKAWGVVFGVLWITTLGLILKYGNSADKLLKTGGSTINTGIHTLQNP